MNIQEQDQLSNFLQQLTLARVDARDTDAERLIQEACKQQPDAYYLLVQRCLLQNQALHKAQLEIERLRSPESRREPASGFLDGSGAWGNSLGSRPMAQAASAPPASPAPAASAWGSGLLGSVASTAAGVVAGSFLFQGIEHLIGNHDKPSSLHSESSEPTTKTPPENDLSNNSIDPGSSLGELSALDLDDGNPDWL